MESPGPFGWAFEGQVNWLANYRMSSWTKEGIQDMFEVDGRDPSRLSHVPLLVDIEESQQDFANAMCAHFNLPTYHHKIWVMIRLQTSNVIRCILTLIRSWVGPEPTILSQPSWVMMSVSQMHFSGSVNCPQFMANRFRKNICTGCQQKIDAHSGASEFQISEALEYAVDKSKKIVYTLLDHYIIITKYFKC